MREKTNINSHINKFRKNALAMTILGAACGLASGAAYAELYVSPVISSSQPGGFNPLSGAPAIQPKAPVAQSAAVGQQAQAVAQAVDRASAVSAPIPRSVTSVAPSYKTGVVQQSKSGFLLSGSAQTNNGAYVAPIMRYGKNIPLSVVFDKLVPKYEGWTVNMEDGLASRKVSWSGGETWKEVLSRISNDNSFTIIVNEAEKAIGVSGSMVMAENLAHKQNQIWKLESHKTLKENLTAWATKAGWSLEWDNGLDIDYPVTNNAVLVGAFAGKGGVIDRVVYSLRNQERPLTAVFYKANNVVLIKEAGFKQSGKN